MQMALNWEEYHGSSRWVQCNHKGPHQREMKARGSESEKEIRQQKENDAGSGFEDERGPGAKECGRPLEAGQDKVIGSSLEAMQKQCGSISSLILA